MWGLASREQARSITDWRRERQWEMVELEGSSAIGDGGQAVASFPPDADGTGSGSLLDSVLATLWGKVIQ